MASIWLDRAARKVLEPKSRMAATGNGDRASALIEQVTSTDGLNDSWKDDFLAALSIFAKIMEIISTILGILALILCWVPVVGQALMVLGGQWDGLESIRLVSCETGRGPFAQQLANELGVPVKAPLNNVWSSGRGHLVQGVPEAPWKTMPAEMVMRYPE